MTKIWRWSGGEPWKNNSWKKKKICQAYQELTSDKDHRTVWHVLQCVHTWKLEISEIRTKSVGTRDSPACRAFLLLTAFWMTCDSCSSVSPPRIRSRRLTSELPWRHTWKRQDKAAKEKKEGNWMRRWRKQTQLSKYKRKYERQEAESENVRREEKATLRRKRLVRSLMFLVSLYISTLKFATKYTHFLKGDGKRAESWAALEERQKDVEMSYNETGKGVMSCEMFVRGRDFMVHRWPIERTLKGKRNSLSSCRRQ